MEWRRPRRWDAVPRQDGRRFVVTGAGAGLGLETARVLADRGASVVLAVRDPAKGRAADLHLDDLDWRRRAYRPFAAYADSKLANLLFVAELQRRLTVAGSTLRATAAHPGSSATGITANTGSHALTWVGSWGHRLVGMPASKGALTTLYAATMDVPGNTFIGPGGLLEMTGCPTGVGRSQDACDPDLAKALWERSEELTGVRFPL